MSATFKSLRISTLLSFSVISLVACQTTGTTNKEPKLSSDEVMLKAIEDNRNYSPPTELPAHVKNSPPDSPWRLMHNQMVEINTKCFPKKVKVFDAAKGTVQERMNIAVDAYVNCGRQLGYNIRAVNKPNGQKIIELTRESIQYR